MQLLRKIVSTSRNVTNSRFFSLKSNAKKVLHVTARHSDQSIVATVYNDLMPRLTFPCDIKERNLWKEPLVPYKIDHVMAKFRIMQGQGTKEDEALFEPIRLMAEELNEADVLVLSSPLWNMSLPYIMKQYVDIVIQPGLNFVETKEWPSKVTPVTSDKSLVVIYSCGAEVGHDALRTDYFGNYVRDVFSLIGFTDYHQIRLSGVMSKPKKAQFEEAQRLNEAASDLLNKKYSI